MAYLGENKFVLDIVPKNLAEDVATNTSISVLFGRDIDKATINANTFMVIKLSSGTRIDGTVTYQNKRAIFVPKTNLEPGATYKVILVGDSTPGTTNDTTALIRDIIGNAMMGDFTSTFTATRASIAPPPGLMTPTERSTYVGVRPRFAFAVVSEATRYELMLSPSNTFEPLAWAPLIYPSDELVANGILTIESGVTIESGEYFWKVRSYVGETPGVWTEARQFIFQAESTPDEGSTPIVSLEVFSTDPESNASEVSTNTITITFSDDVDPLTATASNFIMEPALSGMTIGVDHRRVTLSFAEALPINTRYTVTVSYEVKSVSGSNMAMDYRFSFQTTLSPMYCTVAQIIDDIGPWIASVPHDLIARYINASSLFVDNMAIDFVRDAATNEVIVTYEMKQFVRYDVDMNLIQYKYLEKISRSGDNVVLGDFEIKKRANWTPELQSAYKDIRNQRTLWYDAIMGHHHRRFAKTSSTSKGGAITNPLPDRTWW